MTQLGLNWLAHQENVRANRAREEENVRHNTATETEERRSNLVREGETHRANVVGEGETQRSNLAKEAETKRSNLERELIDARKTLLQYMPKAAAQTYATIAAYPGLKEAVTTTKNELGGEFPELDKALDTLYDTLTKGTSTVNEVVNAGSSVADVALDAAKNAAQIGGDIVDKISPIITKFMRTLRKSFKTALQKPKPFDKWAPLPGTKAAKKQAEQWKAYGFK